MGEGNQNSKYHWNRLDFLFLFFLWHLLGLPETQNCIPDANKKSSQEVLFLVCRDRKGTPLGQKECREIPFWFCSALLFFFFPLPSCHSSEIPAVVEARQIPKLQGRRGTLFDQRNYDPKGIASGISLLLLFLFLMASCGSRETITGSLLQRGETKASLGFLFPARGPWSSATPAPKPAIVRAIMEQREMKKVIP